ncbi:MAG: sigma-70 family RNA polymerase sigma factor [Planctomycetota bacterium]|nr:sigma-70 family RNA polymerase sigma factor [Planctomycetota bacterium]MDA1213494.1 sigma-70 family RNA polymerase sigma factor [Planctomycetota bacterium]
MDDLRGFEQFLAGLKSGESLAENEFFLRFTNQLINKATSHLDSVLRSKVDAEDVVQSVYRTFFRRMAAGQFELKNWDSLWGLLVQITLRKCIRKNQHYRTGRRDVFQEASPQNNSRTRSLYLEFIDHEPTPDEVAIFNETVNSLMVVLNEQQRSTFILALQGHSHVEISRQLRCSERTVRRHLKFIKDDLIEMDMVVRTDE